MTTPIDDLAESEDPMTIDEFHWHEAMHTAHVIEAMFEAHLLSHPAIQANPALLERAKALSNALAEFYNAIGHTRFDFQANP